MSKGVEWTLQRMDCKLSSTYGVLFDENMDHFSFIIEDEYRDVKVSGETRIPAGRYRVKKREVLSPLTKKYRSKYNWFDWHLELQDVPNFTNCYIHIGNTESNTDGCLLPNTNVSLVNGEWVGGNSGGVYRPLYKRLSKELDEGYEVWLNVRDEKYFKSPF